MKRTAPDFDIFKCRIYLHIKHSIHFSFNRTIKPAEMGTIWVLNKKRIRIGSFFILTNSVLIRTLMTKEKAIQSNPIQSDTICCSTMSVIKRIDINHHGCECVASRGKFRQICHSFAGICFFSGNHSKCVRSFSFSLRAWVCALLWRKWIFFLLAHMIFVYVLFCFFVFICVQKPASLWKLLKLQHGTAITFPCKKQTTHKTVTKRVT